MESIHEKLERVRRPRVHIKYEVETEGAVVETELPFVLGVLGDYAGNNPQHPMEPLSQREFVKIDRDNFNDVMERIGPGLLMRVENTLKGDGTEMPVELKFKSIEDFEPARIVDQVEPLRRLLETRNKLRDLMLKVDRSENLENLLEKVLRNTDDLKQLTSELGLDAPKAETPGKEG